MASLTGMLPASATRSKTRIRTYPSSEGSEIPFLELLSFPMEKSTDILLWLVLPLLVIFPYAVHAETVRCKTELRRLCDSALICTRTTEIQPAVEYIVNLNGDRKSARITKTIDGKKAASWHGTPTPSAPGGNLEFSSFKDKNGRFSLSDSLVTFSYRVATSVGKGIGEATEVGICMTGTL